MQIFGDVLAGGKLFTALLAQLVETVLRCQPNRRTLHQTLNARLQLFLFLAQCHALFTGVRHAIGKRGNARFQLLMQSFQFINIKILALTFAEVCQQAFGFLLLAQTLFQFT
ncbi:Uncharacterised protein [Shigella sonnei]|nr:Uncharacterised protein [Shigella sonnei]CSF42075.1 Uncharacterised protein [Shigella sonnei]CSF73704.1 Uncharacterised protein [Shigella sonnei]CSG08606.1 Uncharacterised protein [Shigella sonnei]CSG55606.1 Uncharacterised protein [Shigella sonnei]